MSLATVLWPLLWFWIGASVGIVGAAILIASRSDRRAEPPPRDSIPVPKLDRVSQIVVTREGPRKWDARVIGVQGHTIGTGSGPTVETAIQRATQRQAALDPATNDVA